MNIAKDNITQVALYFNAIDPDISNALLEIDDILKAYENWENILETKKGNIINVVNYILENKSYLETLGFSEYTKLFDLLEWSKEYQEEIMKLLWEEQEYNYLFVLQNTNESRPNGGFFGSFAVVTMYQWRVKNIELVDSYFADYVSPGIQVELPNWSQEIFWVKNTGFVSGNKFWFTDLDWKNLKDLYEIVFYTDHDPERLASLIDPEIYENVRNRYIKWVVFVRLDTLEKLVPDFDKIAWEWQFMNAASLIMHWDESKNKKELYMNQARDFFLENIGRMLNNSMSNLEDIIDENQLNIYLSNVSTWLNNFLTDNNLMTVFENGKMYFWDVNNSYNKIDGFVNKVVEIVDNIWNIVYSDSLDKVDLSDLEKGTYQANIIYSLNIPEKYIEFIEELEEKYSIQLSDRELYILWLQNFNWLDTSGVFVNNQWLVYFDDNIDIKDVIADNYIGEYETPWWRMIKYSIQIDQNNITKNVKVIFEKL